MPKAARLSSSISNATVDQLDGKPHRVDNVIWISPQGVSGKPSGASQLAAVALFSGIGLAISLVAILSGVYGAWF